MVQIGCSHIGGIGTLALGAIAPLRSEARGVRRLGTIALASRDPPHGRAIVTGEDAHAAVCHCGGMCAFVRTSAPAA